MCAVFLEPDAHTVLYTGARPRKGNLQRGMEDCPDHSNEGTVEEHVERRFVGRLAENTAAWTLPATSL